MITASAEIQRIAKLLAYWHGQKMVAQLPGQGMMTVAALAGFGKFGDSASHYADKNWMQYASAAEEVMRDFAMRRRKSKGFRRYLRKARK